MEGHNAVARRDAAELLGRVRQALNGLRGGGSFRWFASGSAGGELERLGFVVHNRDIGRWRGVPTVETLFARLTGRVDARTTRADADYTEIPTMVEQARAQLGTPIAPFTAVRRDAPPGVQEDPNVLPWDVLVRMGKVIDPRLAPSASRLERARRRLGLSRSLDWEELDRLSGRLVTGLPATSQNQ
jgi:hypothetical protein